MEKKEWWEGIMSEGVARSVERTWDNLNREIKQEQGKYDEYRARVQRVLVTAEFLLDEIRGAYSLRHDTEDQVEILIRDIKGALE